MADQEKRSIGRLILSILLPMIVLGAGAYVSWFLISLKKPPRKKPPTRMIPEVELQELTPREATVLIDGHGTVRSKREVTLFPQVPGRLTFCSPKLKAGQFFQKGETLVRIESHDYDIAVTTSNAELKRSLAEEQRLKVRQTNLKRELDVLKEQLTLAQNEEKRTEEAYRSVSGAITVNARDKARAAVLLVKRNVVNTENAIAALPAELQAAEARVEAARTRLTIAKKNQERTVVTAPFDAMVLRSLVERGQYVSPATRLCEMTDTSAFEIPVVVDSDKVLDLSGLPFERVPGQNGSQTSQPVRSPARVHRTDFGRKFLWDGRLTRIEPVDSETRTVPFIVTVKEPFGKLQAGQHPALDIGSYCRVEIQGVTLKDALVIPVSALREGSTVYLWKNGKLSIRPVKVRYRSEDRAGHNELSASEGHLDQNQVIVEPVMIDTPGQRGPSIVPGDMIITSPLAFPVEGMQLKKRGSKRPMKAKP